MCDPLTIGVAMGGASALMAFSSAEQQRSSAAYQADVMKNEATVAENNAKIARQQAGIELQKGEASQRAIDLQRNAMRREYEGKAGTNRSLLAGGNVDITTGSAAESLLGEAQVFSEDLWVNRYNQALAGWEGREASRLQEVQAIQFGNQASSLRSQASWLKKSSGSLGSSLLTAGLSGATGFLGGYSMAGGSLFGAASSTPGAGASSWAERRGTNPFSLTL